MGLQGFSPFRVYKNLFGGSGFWGLGLLHEALGFHGAGFKVLGWRVGALGWKV